MIPDSLRKYVYYEERDIFLLHGDCLEMLPHFPEKSVDLVLTDPPYGLNFPYESYDDTPENLDKTINAVMPMILDKGIRTCLTSGQTNITKYPKPDWVCAVVWNTTGMRGFCGFNQWFPVLFYGKNITKFDRDWDINSDVFQVYGGGDVGFQRDNNEKLHTCPKPFKVWKRILTRFSLKDNLILDPFLGSGTTAVACKQLGRKCIGIELEQKYLDIAVERLRQEVLF